jgi:hypothetical protein
VETAFFRRNCFHNKTTASVFVRNYVKDSKGKIKRPDFSVVDHSKRMVLLDIDNVIIVAGRERQDHPVWKMEGDADDY